jgi:nucleotide-binding universal stress UspA family protein
MFRKILHANDGSDHAFNALSLALQIAKHDNAELHMVSVEQVDHMPELVEKARQDTATAARRFHNVLQRARAMAEENQVQLRTHVIAGHPVRDTIELAAELKVDLLVVGASGHSALYDRMIGSQAQKILITHDVQCSSRGKGPWMERTADDGHPSCNNGRNR